MWYDFIEPVDKVVLRKMRAATTHLSVVLVLQINDYHLSVIINYFTDHFRRNIQTEDHQGTLYQGRSLAWTHCEILTSHNV